MNINHDDLSRLYKAYLKAQTPGSEAHCPRASDIWLFFDRHVGKLKKRNILRHIRSCGCCAEDFQIFHEFYKETDQFEIDIGNWISRNEAKSANKSRNRKASFINSPLLRWGIIGSICALIAIGVFSIYRSAHLIDSSSERTSKNAQPEILLISPANQSIVTKDALRFHWRNDPLSDAYVLELFDESLTRIWKSQLVIENEISVPMEIRDRLGIPAKYLWMVTGYRRSGQFIESALGVFRIIQ
jgi:hypothetical protein